MLFRSDLLWWVMRKGGPRSPEAQRMHRVASRFGRWVGYLKANERAEKGANFGELIELTQALLKKLDERDFKGWPESENESRPAPETDR